MQKWETIDNMYINKNKQIHTSNCSYILEEKIKKTVLIIILMYLNDSSLKSTNKQ